MKTVTDVNTVNQLLTYSKQAEAGIHQKAIQMLLGAGNNKKQDSLSISDAARGFSKQSIAAYIFGLYLNHLFEAKFSSFYKVHHILAFPSSVLQLPHQKNVLQSPSYIHAITPTLFV